MRIDISLLPALAAAFMLVFARIGAMVMLLPGFGETNIPVRIKLAIALALTLIILPLHRAAYTIDMQSLTPLMVMLVHEIVIGVVVSLIQALTQIQEQTLIFVPKILAIFVTLLLALPFMADALQGHMMRISSRIIGG